MTTIARFYHAPYQQRHEAVVTAVTDDAVVTDASIFYPTGGGQPGDTGHLAAEDGRRVAVVDTHKGEGRAIVHRLAPGHGLEVGGRVVQQLDWPRRYAHMRMHTALHLLSVALPFAVTGGRIAADAGRLDFDLGQARPDKAELTATLNDLIAADHPVTDEWVDEATLDAHPQWVKTMAVAPPRGVGDIRMVRIGEIDYQPCGGTHVASTAEIGALEVASIKNRGARNRRVTLRWAPGAGAS